MNKQNNPNSKPGRTPQDKINRHVAFALHNSESRRMPENTLSPEILQTLANWYKELQHLNTLPLDDKNWQYGLCRNSLTLAGQEKDMNILFNIRERLFKCWPKYSGNTTFPIEGHSIAYIEPTPEYKQLRKELSLHCIAELEKLLILQHSFGNFPLEHRIKILKILKKLYRLPATNDSWGIGLCYTICDSFPCDESSREIDSKIINYLKEHFKTWKYFSGIAHNPIPQEADINKTYSRRQLRKNLCGHAIKSIEAELNYVL